MRKSSTARQQTAADIKKSIINSKEPQLAWGSFFILLIYFLVEVLGKVEQNLLL
jgi:hypothetical protein